MAYKLQLKRGASGSLPTGSAGEPLFTTDTNDLYIGTGAANQRFQKYIASGTSSQFLKGDGSLDSGTYQAQLNGTGFVKISGTTISYDNTSYLPLTGGTLSSASSAETLRLINTGTGYGLYNQSDSYFQGDVKFQSVSNTILKVDASNKLIAAVAGTDYQAPITNPVTGTGTSGQVAYFNGTSSITSESNLFWDATNDRLGIGTTSPAYTLDVNSTARVQGDALYVYNTGSIELGRDTTYSTPYMALGFGGRSNSYNKIYGARDTTDGLYIHATTGRGIKFEVNGASSSSMTLDSSGNLLVNSTTDNGNRLQVTGNGSFSGFVTAGNSILISNTINAYAYQNFGANTGYGWQIGKADNSGGIAPSNSFYIYDLTNSATRLTINQYGNLGLGVTPSAWATLVGFDIVEGGGAISSNQGGLYLTENAYYNAGWKYKSSTISSALYSQVLGTHAWYNAPSGTAGNAITFTQAMTLTSGGNLLVGTTTDSGEKLQVDGSAKITGNTIIGTATTADVFSRGYSGRILGISASGQSAIELNSSTGNGVYFDMGVNGARTFGIFSDITNSEVSTTGSYPLLLSTNSVPRLTIKANGSINYTPMATPASAVAGDVYYDSTSNKLRCYNGTSWNDLF